MVSKPVRVALTVAFFAAPTSAGYGPISTTRPVPPGGNIANDQPPTSFFQGLSPPFPTDDWWVGYAAGKGDAMVAGPFPYQSRLSETAIHFGVSTNRQFDGVSIKQPTQIDWSVSFMEHSGLLADHKAAAWDTQTVAVQYSTGNSSVLSYMVPGSPYMTFKYSDATPVFKSINGLIRSFSGKAVVDGGPNVTATGTIFQVVNSAGSYTIYTLNGPITLVASAISGGGSIVASGQYNGVLRVAKVALPAHQATLDKYVSNYATSVTTGYSFPARTDTAILQFTWKVVGNPSNLLQLSWPHHRRTFLDPNHLPTTSLAYLTTKGYMYPVLGSVWKMQYKLPTITWNAPRQPQAACRPDIIKGLEYEVRELNATIPSAPGDFYFWGGRYAAISRLALIAEQVDRKDLIPPIIEHLKTAFGYWTSASGQTQAAYETAWGGIINKAAATNVWVDFGNGYYNDHHFHYGYLLNIGAVIAKFDPSWLRASAGAFTNGDFLSWFARDIANPSTLDPYFTLTRHRDWFAGHSWASGIANGAGARDQESIGEAVNGYYGVLLYADVAGKTELKNYAKLLIATEQHAAKVYWHLYPSADGNGRDEPYPEQGARDLVTMGNIMDWQVGAWLFWGAQRTQIAAIQMLPVIPINEDMYDDEWVKNVWAYTAAEMDDPSIGDDFKSVIQLAYSNYDPAGAAICSSTLSAWGSGNTYTHQLYFLSTRPNPTNVAICTSSASNLEGTFVLQDVTSGKFVTSSASRNELYADGAACGVAYEFAFMPGGGSIKAVSTSKYVTADQSGTSNVAAARAVPSAWEAFVIRQKVGAQTGIFSILALSNKMYLTRGANGALSNSAAAERASAGFRLIPATGSNTTSICASDPIPPAPGLPDPAPPSNPNPQGTFVLQETTSGRYVTALESRRELLADSQSACSAFLLQNETVKAVAFSQFVTADQSGSTGVAAVRDVASGWENFVINPKVNGSVDVYTIMARSNGRFLIRTSSGALVNSATNATAAAGFKLIDAANTTVCVLSGGPSKNPVGDFVLQEAATGNFVTSANAIGELFAESSTSCAVWRFQGENIKSIKTGLFVTANQSGTSPIASARQTASGWESFIVHQKAGAATGVYSILATSNNHYVVRSSTGALINSATTETTGSGFKLVDVASAPPAACLTPVAPVKNPVGDFVLQDIQTGNYVTSVNASGELYAQSSTSCAAWAFQGETMKSVQTNLYVTADQAGSSPIAAARQAASGWETFVINQKTGATAGVYSILATSNKRYVVRSSTGALVNSATTENASSGFKFIDAKAAGVCLKPLTPLDNPLGSFLIKELSGGKYLQLANDRGELSASATNTSQAGTWIFEGGHIKSAATKLFVTADQSGTIPIAAAREVPNAWEEFIITTKANKEFVYTIQAMSNQKYAALGVGSVLVNSASVEADAAELEIIGV